MSDHDLVALDREFRDVVRDGFERAFERAEIDELEPIDFRVLDQPYGLSIVYSGRRRVPITYIYENALVCAVSIDARTQLECCDTSYGETVEYRISEMRKAIDDFHCTDGIGDICEMFYAASSSPDSAIIESVRNLWEFDGTYDIDTRDVIGNDTVIDFAIAGAAGFEKDAFLFDDPSIDPTADDFFDDLDEIEEKRIDAICEVNDECDGLC